MATSLNHCRTSRDLTPTDLSSTPPTLASEKMAHSILPYMPALDGLRGIAVLSVIFGHFRLPGFYGGGGYGVDVFFVLSGYLISSIVMNSIDRGKPLFEFYWYRFTRLFPPLILVCLTLFFLPERWLTYWGAALNTIGATLYVTNWTRAFPTAGWPNFMAHSWSLSVEEQFYLVWPIFLFVTNRYLGRHMKWAVVAITILSFAWLVALWINGAKEQRIYNGFDGRCHAIMLGACLTFCPNLKIGSRIATVALAGYFAMVLCLNWSPMAEIPICIISALLVTFARKPTGFLSAPLQSSPLVLAGIISYSAYLWHWPICYALFEKMNVPQMISAPVGISLSFLMAYLTTVYIEYPIRASRSVINYKLREIFGRVLAIGTFSSIIGGLIFFYGGFIRVAPY